MTDLRLSVLEIIASSDKPLGAYDILDAMRAIIDNPKPPTAYRAIEFLKEHGFVHRIESLNAYVACHAGHRHEGSQYMICDSCGDVTEIHLCSMPAPLENKTSDFKVAYWNAEIHGMCGLCAKS